MAEILDKLPTLVIAVVAAYILGALPLADQLSRRHGVDIFSTGTGLAGASNVLHSVGRLPALIVFIGDMGKGALAMMVAEYIGVQGPWILLPAGAAITGHWKSLFTGFRGGDGLTTLGGATIAVFPTFGAISIAIAMVVALGGQMMPYSSLLSVVFGYTALAYLSVAYNADATLALGLGGLAGLVLAHALLGHRRRRHGSDDWEEEELGEAEGATKHSSSSAS